MCSLLLSKEMLDCQEINQEWSIPFVWVFKNKHFAWIDEFTYVYLDLIFTHHEEQLYPSKEYRQKYDFLYNLFNCHCLSVSKIGYYSLRNKIFKKFRIQFFE